MNAIYGDSSGFNVDLKSNRNRTRHLTDVNRQMLDIGYRVSDVNRQMLIIRCQSSDVD